MKLTETVLVCLLPVPSGLFEINPQFAKRDVKILRLYTALSHTADTRLRHLLDHSPDHTRCEPPPHCVPCL